MKAIIILAVLCVLSSWQAEAQPNLREVNGQIYNSRLSQLWQIQTGKILEVQTNGIVLQTFTTHNVYQNVWVPGIYGVIRDRYEKRVVSSDLIPAQRLFINNCSNGAIDQKVSIPAMKIGTIKIADQVLEEWDCGTPYVAPPPTPEEIAAAKAKNELAAKAVEAKAYQAQANAVRWLQAQATNGDASAQCSLGMHYLNGQGCETNREQAIYWLKKAADQGDLEASNTLARLQK